MSLAGGTKLGPYEIQTPLGAGGMGEVYRARDTRLERAVAIKILPPAFSSEPERLQRFQQEARVLSALNHPNLLSIYDVGNQDGMQYLVSELLEGQTLREKMSGGPLPSRKVSEYALQLANGLAAAHAKGIVHRDLKPENVFVTRDERMKILDFGLAKQVPANASGEGATLTSPTPTAAGMVMGTAGYMSPEQVRGQTVDHRSDIFAFGTILYEMVSGERAFKGDSSVETMNAILKDEPPELTQTSLQVSPGIERILGRCLEKAPERRFQSASDLGFAIEALSGVSSSTAGQKAIAVTPRKRHLALVASVAALGVAALAFFVGGRVLVPKPAEFQQIIFGRGFISTARFTPDGESVVYGATWSGKPREIFSARLDGLASRSMGLPPADVLGISPTGDMAISLGRHNYFHWMTIGTLGRVPLSGGAPRSLMDDVCDADISADGKDFAVVRCGGELQTLEFPIGKVLYQTAGWINHPRIGPHGDVIAFLDHPLPGDDRGYVAVVDRSGKVTRLTQEWTGENGLAWSASGDEVWFTSAAASEPSSLRAVTLSGKSRVILSTIAAAWLQDVDQKGEVLLMNSRESSDIVVRRPGLNADQMLDLPDESASMVGLSEDGSVMALNFSGGGGSDYSSYIVRADTPEPIRLGVGDPIVISPDGKWVLSLLPSSPGKFILYPTGTGESRTIDVSPVRALSNYASWTRDGAHVLITGGEPGKPSREFLLDVKTGSARPVTPEGTSEGLISPDGRTVVAKSGSAGFAIYPVAGGDSQMVKGLAAGEFPVQWDSSGSKLYVWDRIFPAQVTLLDPLSGVRQHWLEITPGDKAGLLYGNLVMTPDGRSYACRYRRVLTNLFLARGLR